jgi:mannose-1-phosphate guanylyltransferase
MKLLVVAGGQGTKLWPYSREHKPKQFQPVLGEKSLFTNTIDTLLSKYPAEDIYISTKQKFIKYVSDQAPQIPLRNYIIEPNITRDTGPALGLACLRLAECAPNEPFMLIQSDCVRQPEAEFIQMIADAETIVARDKKLITGGIKATEPNMGVDYFRLGERLHKDTKQEVYAIDEFIYRGSSYQETKNLIESFSAVVHSNHYCWYPELMLEAIEKYQPGWHRILMQMREAFGKPGEDAEIERLYAEMEKGTIEDGRVVTVDATDSLVKTSNPNKLVALAGIDNLVVVDTDDVLLIIPKSKIEKIKDIQKQLAKDHADDNYL